MAFKVYCKLFLKGFCHGNMFPTHFRLHKTSFSLRQVLAYGGSPTKTSKRHANYIDNPNRNEAKTYTSVNTEERVSFTLSVRGKFSHLHFREALSQSSSRKFTISLVWLCKMPEHLWISAWVITKECIPFDWYDWVWQFLLIHLELFLCAHWRMWRRV